MGECGHSSVTLCGGTTADTQATSGRLMRCDGKADRHELVLLASVQHLICSAAHTAVIMQQFVTAWRGREALGRIANMPGCESGETCFGKLGTCCVSSENSGKRWNHLVVRHRS